MQTKAILAVSILLTSGALSTAHAKQCTSPAGGYMWNASLSPSEIPGSGGVIPTSTSSFATKNAYYRAQHAKTALDACRKWAKYHSPGSIWTASQRATYAVQQISDTSYKCAFDCYSPVFGQNGDGVVDANDYSQCPVLINAMTYLQTEPMCDQIPNGPYKDLGTPRGFSAGQKFTQYLRDKVIAKNQSLNQANAIISDMSNLTAEPFDLLNRMAQTDTPFDDDAWADELGKPNATGTYASSVQIDHIIPRVDVQGCACGPNTFANALVISASLNGAMSNNSQDPTRMTILQTYTKSPFLPSLEEESDHDEFADDAEVDPESDEIGGCSTGAGGGIGAGLLVGLGLALRRRRQCVRAIA